MMMMADGGSGLGPSGDILGVDDFDGGGEGDWDLTVDVDTLLDMLDEPDDPPQSTSKDSSHQNLDVLSTVDLSNSKNCYPQNGFQMLDGAEASESESINPATVCSSQNPNVLDARFCGSVNSMEYGGSSVMASDDDKQEPFSQFSYPMDMYSGSFTEWHLPYSKDNERERVDVSHSGMTGCSEASTPPGESVYVSDYTGAVDINALLGESGAHLRVEAGKNGVEDVLQDSFMDSCSDGKSGNGGGYSTENSVRFPGPENASYSLSDMPYSATEFDNNSVDAYLDRLPSFVEDCSFDFYQNEVDTTNNKDKVGEFLSESECSVSETSMFDNADTSRLSIKNEVGNTFLPRSQNISSNTALERIPAGKWSRLPTSHVPSAINERQPAVVEKEKPGEAAAFNSMVDHPDASPYYAANHSGSCTDESSLEEESKQSFSDFSSRMFSLKNSIFMKNEKGDKSSAPRIVQVQGNVGEVPLNGVHVNVNASDRYFARVEQLDINKKMKVCIKGERNSNIITPKSWGHLSSISRESVQSNLSGSSSHVDDDSDICILEDISQPPRMNQSLMGVKVNAPRQPSAYGNSADPNAVGTTRNRGSDERLIFRAALQDLSQPKSEANPPEGVLAVPLLRHQRIALSWMIQKETSSVYCSGGILADDQGLGKTVSTIALILKERPVLLKTDMQVVKKEEFATLDLDGDGDDVTEVDTMRNGYLCPSERSKPPGHSKGRPSAGTLVVCPTSVLRQWNDELHKKVTSKANLSVLVYHGSNRTKDPHELAKYDVVLTTYAIVSMEVPKQPDEDDDEKEKAEGDDVASLGLSSGKKRKYPPTYGKKGKKKNVDAALLESFARPLAKVAWFRVVLDEAQSIKNHRTQVARACWGLRAKRRWCLSGTPIQNAIDDLYSYFRFLRYDPYAVYNSFCSTLKVPVQRNPTKGYKKLQAVLRTIMLRRTKCSKIDGKPIITLPPKLVELRKVDFTDEERDFYTRLEAESRDQFREYAAAGTVKQNYVNILLMLLRLRQACDHPLLVRGAGSNSLGKSSIEIASKLPREKQIDLLKSLEASLALCGICNDPPEDAVVSICGHVFCNQCICERLTGDDNQCPNSKCMVRLSVSSVFSKATLKSSLSGQPAEGVPGSEITGSFDQSSESFSYNSSKIKAALEVLQSLTQTKDCMSTTGTLDYSPDGNSSVSPENSCSSGSSGSDARDNAISSVKVVGEKAIVFSQWTRMLDLLEACLKNSSIQYRRLDGTMSVVARDKAVQDFNTRPEVSVMIMSLKAASLGLNMVAACRVLLLDLWWNPTTEDQAIDRAHRIGQTRPVTVLRLTVKDTVEDRILALQQKKREMVASAFGEDETGGRQTRLTVEDLNYLFMV